MIDGPYAGQGANVSEPAFDQARADAALHALGSAIVNDASYQSREWDAIVLVFELDGRTSDFGYVYGPGDEWEAEGPDNWDVLTLAKDFREATRVPGKDHWKKCLVRIARETGRIEIEFDYDGTRWVPDMADPGGFARSLRTGAEPAA